MEDGVAGVAGMAVGVMAAVAIVLGGVATIVATTMAMRMTGMTMRIGVDMAVVDGAATSKALLKQHKLCTGWLKFCNFIFYILYRLDLFILICRHSKYFLPHLVMQAGIDCY
jgi:hypothetical protein